MKNTIIYSKINPEALHKQPYKECDSAKLNPSQLSSNNTFHNKPEQHKIRVLEEEIRNLREENEYIKANNIHYCKQINVIYKIKAIFLIIIINKEYEVNKMNAIEKIEINLQDLLSSNDTNQTKTLIRRLTNNNERILKEQKDLVSYCNLLTKDFMKVNEKVL